MDSIEVKKSIMDNLFMLEWLEETALVMVTALRHQNRIYFCGNGGSAADAQHLAAELSGRFMKDRSALPAEALHVNSSFLTAVANDMGYDRVFSRYLEAMSRPGDVLVALSTSGKSANVLEALHTAKNRGMTTIGITGLQKGAFDQFCHFVLHIPSHSTPRIQEATILCGHILCEIIENTLFPD